MRSRRGLILIALPVLALLVFAALASQNYEVVSKTRLYDSDTLYEIRLFDAFNVKAKPDVKPSPDVLNSLLLVVAATLSLGTAILLGLVSSAPRPRRFFGIVSAGAAFLAADELMGGHETIGQNLGFLADLPVPAATPRSGRGPSCARSPSAPAYPTPPFRKPPGARLCRHGPRGARVDDGRR